MLIRAVAMACVHSTGKTMAGNVFANQTIWATDVLFPWTRRTCVCCTIRRVYMGHVTIVRTPIRARVHASLDTKENNALLKLTSVTPIRAKTGLNASTISTAFTVTVLLYPVNTVGIYAKKR